MDRDEKPARARLELTGSHGPYRIRVLEILISGAESKYADYVFQDDEVVIGFDNAADPRALLLKYETQYTEHRLERIPHCHVENMTSLALTDEMDCDRFIDWVQSNLLN